MSNMNDLELSRKTISRVDAEMARLFEERMHACEKIAGYKREHGLSVRDPAREAELISRSRSMIESPEIEEYYVRFLKNTIELSCRYQTRLLEGMKVAYCGDEGAFACIAAGRMFPGAALCACSDFTEAYRGTESGTYDCAVLPLENSYAGEVGTVMDLLFSGGLFVNQVIDLPVTHSLIALPGASPEGIRRVISHPQALAQCRDYIRAHGYETESFTNTALAVKHVRELGDPGVAAIAAQETADIFGMKVLDARINDNPNNTTRFAALSRVQNRPAAAARREDESFILVFTVRNEAGSLAQTLNIIGAHGFNMRAVRSRPMKDLQWSYFFYIEAEGNVNTENGREMLQELSAVCAKLRLVGTFYSHQSTQEQGAEEQ